jgi:hypothetical protein
LASFAITSNRTTPSVSSVRDQAYERRNVHGPRTQAMETLLVALFPAGLELPPGLA